MKVALKVHTMRQTISSPTFSRIDDANLESVLPACIEALSIEQEGQRQTFESANEPLELIRRSDVETDSNSLITRMNESFQSLLKIPGTSCGQTLILFVAKEDRKRFVKQFFRFRRREAFQRGAASVPAGRERLQRRWHDVGQLARQGSYRHCS